GGGVGGGGTDIPGLADWCRVGGGAPRRIGLVHGGLNATGKACYVPSLCLRQIYSRRAGRGFALLGLAVSSLAAYLGGHLVFKEKLGVDHTADYSPPEDFVPVLAEAELRENELRRVQANGMPILLVRRGHRIYAIAETSPHLPRPPSE